MTSLEIKFSSNIKAINLTIILYEYSCNICRFLYDNLQKKKNETHVKMASPTKAINLIS